MRLLTKMRIALLSLAGLVFFSSFIIHHSSFAQTQTPANNWSQFRGNQQLTGLTAQAGLPDKLSVKWSVDLGGAVESSAAIVGQTVLAASAKGELVALNLADGKVWWRFKVDEVGESSPAYNGNDGLVGAGGKNLPFDGGGRGAVESCAQAVPGSLLHVEHGGLAVLDHEVVGHRFLWVVGYLGRWLSSVASL